MYSLAVDKKWQKRWRELKLGTFDESRSDRKLYVLEMFSYPSASTLHIGHWFNYGPPDTWARLQKMRGYEVFQPIGFDAFGLPAENYAIKTGVHPATSTWANIKTMTEQLETLGGLFDWSSMLATCDPEYYRWNQWLFLQLFKHGLAYRKNAPVNWCPSCQTVLANEQVLSDGTCERCGAEVTHKALTQWFFKITAYADELIDALPTLDWPEQTKKIQTNWIGRSYGAHVSFVVEKDKKAVLTDDGTPLTLDVFTTRVDTLMGVTYLVIAPESPLLDALVTPEQRDAVAAYQEQSAKASDIARLATTREKTGVFTGAYAVHPLTGETVPVWTADYVLASYGTGVVMAVPAHDTRDYAFATRYALPIRRVIKAAADDLDDTLPFVDPGVLVNSGAYTDLTSEAARDAIVSDLKANGAGDHVVTYRLRDWLVSRQRYWGTPIPIIHCDHCGLVPVPEEDLPVRLPSDVAFTPDGASPLARCESFLHTTCPQCGRPALRDPDTLDTFVCSSWYQFRFVDNKNDRAPFDTKRVDARCPVDQYIGGQEHAAMHLLYARFITKALRDLGWLHFDEPFQSLIHQGMILGADGQKMSKSRGNTVIPDLGTYGGDVLRLHLMFSFAYTEGGVWNDDGVLAMSRFVHRIEQLIEAVVAREVQDADDDPALDYALHYALRGATNDALKFQFNTALARLMELLNTLQKNLPHTGAVTTQYRRTVETFITMLAPFAPHFSEEMWETLGHGPTIFYEAWPTVDESKLVTRDVEIAIQINGHIKARLVVPVDIDQPAALERAKAHPEFARWLDGRTLVKAIYVKNRLLNLVVKPPTA